MTCLYVQHLKQPDHVSTDSSLKTFDINDHVRGWNRAKTRTASKPHGLSFSHYKAATKNPDLAAFDYLMREIPLG